MHISTPCEWRIANGGAPRIEKYTMDEHTIVYFPIRGCRPPRTTDSLKALRTLRRLMLSGSKAIQVKAHNEKTKHTAVPTQAEQRRLINH